MMLLTHVDATDVVVGDNGLVGNCVDGDGEGVVEVMVL